ncbi:MAG: type I restriction enzyme HsdR N-terminal domain-containing protein [Desulfobacterales bacterium]|jgi:hypothetical protein|nr:type I restriction enzyme HsdR N-terminal domain-containing protein [Desulfobacterales bacterium]
MATIQKPYTLIEDFVTGQQVPNVGAEANRQAMEKVLVQEKGFLKSDIEVDAAIEVTIAGEPYESRIDLVVSTNGQRIMAIKCAAGSLSSREREIVAAARLIDTCQIPLAVVSDGAQAIVLDTLTGKKISDGMDAVPTKAQAVQLLKDAEPVAFPENKREREKLVFRTYDIENVNVRRNIVSG